METGRKFEKVKARTCLDVWRHRHRRIRRIDPAASTALQLLLIILILVGRAPVVPDWWPRKAAALPLPARDDWCEQQAEREWGEGGSGILQPRRGAPRLHGRYRSSPSYRRLVADLRRPAARAEALDILRRRLALPDAAKGWLDDISDNQDWAVLAACTPPRKIDADAEIALLRSALSWLQAKQQEEDGSTDEQRADGDGKGVNDFRPADGGDPPRGPRAP